MRRIVLGTVLFSAAMTSAGQTPKQEFTDPKALLDAVAQNYAGGADGFHLEAIETTVQKSELEDSRSTVYRTAIQGPENLYRIDTRSPYGTYTVVSDGKTEWMYLAETKMYAERPVPQDWPGFPKILMAGQMELRSAWGMRTELELDTGKGQNPTLLPEETISIAGRSYLCYVVHATQDGKGFHNDTTYWIDKQALVLRKQFKRWDTYTLVTKEVQFPLHMDITTIYPVADFGPQANAELFRFTPPADAKKIASFEPDFDGFPENHPKTQLAGQMAPDVTLTRADGTKVALNSLRGKPVLIDFWATWCGPCIASMPSLHRVYDEVKNKGIRVLGIDEDNKPEDATAYLARHKYAWDDFHDTDKQIQKTFKDEGIPLVVLIDAQGKIVYYDFGGNEETLRRAIAALGPEFASVAPVASVRAASQAAKKN